MVVGIDLRCLPADGSAGAGVTHAARFLTEALLSLDVPWEWRLYIPSGADQNVFIPPLTKGEKKGVLSLPDTSGSALRRALREHPCDLLFVPGGSVAPLLPVPAIPWVHDLAIFDHPEWFPQSWLRRFITTTLFRRGIQKAPLVFSVSEETRRQIVSRFHIAPEKVVVTHEGGDPFLTSVIPVKTGTQNSAFVLFLGTIEPRKNLSMLLKAWNLALPSLPEDMELVIAGKDGWKCADLIREIKKMPRVRHIIDVDDEKRRELLQTATLVVLPSLYEGFGLVALEAMQAGTPLVASNAGSLPEVVGSGGLLLDPHDVASWANAIQNLIADDAARQRLVEKGRERAKDFSWRKTAEVIAAALQKEERLRGR